MRRRKASLTHIPKTCILKDSMNTEIVFNPLNLKNNNNGKNCCWINSSLYAFLSNEYVVNILLERTIEDYEKQARDDHDSHSLHELKQQLLVFKNNPDGGWVNDNYSKLYDLILSKYNWRPEDFGDLGDFGDARVTFDLFLACFERRTRPRGGPDGKLKLESDFGYINTTKELCKFLQYKENYICISFVLTDDCLEVKEMGQDIDDAGHYVAYSRINQHKWRKMDSGNTIKDEYFNNIIGECPENEKLYVYGLFLLKDTL